LLRLYNNSPYKAITKIFNTHIWKAWKFSSPPKGWYRKLGQGLELKDPDAIKLAAEYLADLSIDLELPHLEDWQHAVNENRLPIGLSLYEVGKVEEVLCLVYPSHPWKFNSTTIASLSPPPPHELNWLHRYMVEPEQGGKSYER